MERRMLGSEHWGGRKSRPLPLGNQGRILGSGLYPRVTRAHMSQETYMRLWQHYLCSQKAKSKCPSIGEWINKLVFLDNRITTQQGKIMNYGFAHWYGWIPKTQHRVKQGSMVAFGLVPKYPKLNSILFRDIYICSKHKTEVRKLINPSSD